MANMYGYNTSSAHKLDERSARTGHERHNETSGQSNGDAQGARAARTAKSVKASRLLNFFKVAACFTVAFVIISRYVAINEANSRIAELKKEYNSIIATNQDLQAKIDKTVDLKKLQTVASEKLGMVRPERYQIFYVDMQLDDSCENVAAEKANDEREKVAVTGVPGTIIGSMKIFK